MKGCQLRLLRRLSGKRPQGLSWTKPANDHGPFIQAKEEVEWRTQEKSPSNNPLHYKIYDPQ